MSRQATLVAHIREVAGPAMRFAAWQGSTLPGRRDVQEAPAPAAHAGLRPPRVVVRHDIVDHQPALERARAPPRRRASPASSCARGRHQRGAVAPAPSRNTGHARPPAAARRARRASLDQLRQLVEVLAVDHGVERSAAARLRAPAAPNASFVAWPPRIAADALGAAGLGVLQAELHMVQPGRRPGPADRGRVEQHAGGDEVGVEPGLGGAPRPAPPGRAAPSARRPRDGPAGTPSAAASSKTRAQVGGRQLRPRRASARRGLEQ